MLDILIPEKELWDEKVECFVSTKEQCIRLEHSLVSISKWESKWNKPFLTKEVKSDEETIDYIRCMTLTKNVDINSFYSLQNDDLEKIKTYIELPMTATSFIEYNRSGTGMSREIITSELIYYWMISLNIPIEFQKWHLNRLLTLIKVCNIKNAPLDKMSQKEIMTRNSALNAARRKQLNSNG